VKEITTYCRICEPMCGLVATVDDGILTRVRGDRDNPYSKGFVCTKASGMVEVVYDADRILRPLRRKGGPGDFEEVSWDEALNDIATRLKAIMATHGGRSIGSFIGNPPFFGFAAPTALNGFLKAIDSPWKYSINGEDAASRFASQAILYGSPSLLIKPDLWRTRFALVLGANPVVSKGSMVNEPQIRQALAGVVERGGRVVVVDPRNTETARQFEHLPVQAGTDAWLLLGMLRVLVDENLIDSVFLARHATGFDRLKALLSGFELGECSARCGVPIERITEVARALAAAPSATVYGRTGTCTQRFGTLNNILQDLLMIVTGNIERPGGGVFGWAPIKTGDIAEKAGLNTYAKYRTRVRGLPDAFGLLPAQGLAEDITTPGRDRLRALVMVGGNPVVTSGVARELPEALEQLDLFVAMDLYVNETNKHAHYVLPVPTFYEREDIPLGFLGNMIRPSIFVTDAVIPPRGDVRSEEDILDEIARRMGLGSANPVALLRWLGRFGVQVKAKVLVDILLRASSVGDWFGLKPRGLSWKKLRRNHPHGVLLKAELPIGDLGKLLKTPDRKIPVASTVLDQELSRLRAHVDDPAYPFRMIGIREVPSHNSWMHNVERLVPDGRSPKTRIHPADAEQVGVGDGELVRIESKAGSITLPASVTLEMNPGTIAVPHGWGHHGGWQRANAAGGACSNLLVSTATEDVEPLAGMSILNGIPVRLTRVEQEPSPTGEPPRPNRG
jgi:anaerobic selenocysteine-containing dehydrogenase